MHQIYPNQGLLYALHQLAGAATGNLVWHLFTNNIIPALTNVLADFALDDADFPPITVSDVDFTFEQVFTNIGSIQAPNIIFTNGAGGALNVYGYVITDPSSTLLFAAARFDSAPLLVAGGHTVVVTPILGDLSDLS